MRTVIEKAREMRKRACVAVDEELTRLGKAKDDLKHAAECQVLIQTAAQAVQERAHNQIAAVVTKCLRTVFEDDYEFRIDFEKKRGKTEARLLFLKGGKEEDPMDGSGGGVLDVASFALRLSCIMLRRPRGRKILILDEPFKNVNGENNRDRAAALLTALAEEFDVQIIMATGDDWLKIGTVVEV